MIHLHYFITRKPALGEEEFHRYWRETHAPIVNQVPQLKRRGPRRATHHPHRTGMARLSWLPRPGYLRRHREGA